MNSILALAGSTRADSYNQQLMRVVASGAEAAGGNVTIVNLADYPLPIFNEDLESDGTPEAAKQLKQQFLDHQGLIIASPEYNSSISPLLKNAIDWVSRAADDQPSLAAYQGKVASLVSASPGALGGLRGLVHVRSILSSIGVTVLPQQLAVGKAFEAFDEGGKLKNPKQQSQAESIGAHLAAMVAKIHGD